MSTFPKKGSKTIEVCGEKYLWRVNQYGDDHDPDRQKTKVMIQHVESRTTREKELPGHVAILPSMVEGFIKAPVITKEWIGGVECEVETVFMPRRRLEAATLNPQRGKGKATSMEEHRQSRKRMKRFYEDLNEDTEKGT